MGHKLELNFCRASYGDLSLRLAVIVGRRGRPTLIERLATVSSREQVNLFRLPLLSGSADDADCPGLCSI